MGLESPHAPGSRYQTLDHVSLSTSHFRYFTASVFVALQNVEIEPHIIRSERTQRNQQRHSGDVGTLVAATKSALIRKGLSGDEE